MPKRRAKSAREGKNKPFGGAAADTEHDQLRRKAAASSVPHPLSNQMLYSLKGYLDNITAAPTQAVSNVGPLDEFSVSLAVSVDTVDVQAKEIKGLYQHINALKNKGTQKFNSETNDSGGMTRNVCPHCSGFGRSVPHKNGSCYFDPKKMTERRGWDCKLMDKKVVTCKDDG